MTPLRVVFMGTPDFSVPTLEALVQAGHNIVGVYCQPDKEKGRGKQVQMPAVKVAALAHDLPVYQPVTLKSEEVEAELRALEPDVIIVIAYGKILPPWLIRLPKYGCINVHASILPKYRGAAPIHYAILNGDTKTGVTIMHMDDGLDTGDIIDVETIEILPNETTGELFERIATLGGTTINPVLERWVAGEIIATPQDDTKASHRSKITKDMGLIDWNSPAFEVANKIKALNPAPGCFTFINGKRLKLWMAESLEESSSVQPGTIVAITADSIDVATKDGILRLKEVQPDNKKRMSAGDFSRGHQLKVGMTFGE